MKKLLNRNEVPVEQTWDLTRIFKTEKEYEEALKELKVLADEIGSYKGHINSADKIIEVLGKVEKYLITDDLCAHYASLDNSTDYTDEFKKNRMMKYLQINNQNEEKISFYNKEIADNSVEVLDEAIGKSDKYKKKIQDIKREKPHMLDEKTQEVVDKLMYVLDAPYRTYETAKLSDMHFDKFKANGKELENSFVLFENHYQYQVDTEERRNAFKSFSESLSHYKDSFAAYYDTYLQTEKRISELKGFKTLRDYHLFIQNVDPELYNRQLDVIMEYLAPHMRKYAGILKKLYNLDEVRFSDMKLPIHLTEPENYEFEEAKPYVKKALSVLGDEYAEVAMSAFKNRWVDYSVNKGKSTGGFCASPWQKDGFILMSWTGALDDMFTLVHEIGHGVHFHYAQNYNSYFTQEPSLYFIEAPSTMNEVLLSKSLLECEEDKLKRAQIQASMVSNTYYHNFVTHFLEAYYQREVYNLVEENVPITSQVMSQVFKETLEKFFGDTVVLDEGSELTWMRQPHYYMGLYSYTYSAGLTVGTLMANRIYEDKEAYKDWIEVLKSGGQKDVIELAKTAGIDITTDGPLKQCIEYVGEMISNIESAVLDK